MKTYTLHVLRCRWDDIPAGTPDPPIPPDGTLLQMYSTSDYKAGVGWFWRAASFGEIAIRPGVVVDVGALAGLSYSPPADTPRADRLKIAAQAVKQALAMNFVVEPGDVVVVFISPGGSDAGGTGSQLLPGTPIAVLDMFSRHTFCAHEIGHLLGLVHSRGPFARAAEADYGDVYCMMSAELFGEYHAMGKDLIPTPMVPPGIPPAWTDRMGPLPAAATMWAQLSSFETGSRVQTIDLRQNPDPSDITVRAFAGAPGDATVLVVARGTTNTVTAELRWPDGWDGGLTGELTDEGEHPSPGLVIHRSFDRGPVYTSCLPPASASAERVVWIGSVGVVLVAVDEVARTAVVRLRSRTPRPTPFMAWRGSKNSTDLFHGTLPPGPNWSQTIAQDSASTHGPALCTLGNELWMAWKGVNGDEQIYLSRWLGSGWTRQQTAERGREGLASAAGPALAAFADQLYLAWRGPGDDRDLYWSRYELAQTRKADGSVQEGESSNWRAGGRLGDRASTTGPALAAGAGLHMMWKGAKGDSGIYYAELVRGATTLDDTWGPQQRIPNVGTSERPALIVLPTPAGEPERLLASWKGTEGDTGLYQSRRINGIWEPQSVVPGVGSEQGPALAFDGLSVLWRAWRGAGADRNIYWSRSTSADGNVQSWSPQARIDTVATIGQPAMTVVPPDTAIAEPT